MTKKEKETTISTEKDEWTLLQNIEKYYGQESLTYQKQLARWATVVNLIKTLNINIEE